MNVPIPNRWKIKDRELKELDYAIQVCQHQMHNIEPETEDFGRLTIALENLRATRQQLLDGHKLTGDQKVMIFKILMMCGLGLVIASMSYWYPTAEKTLKFLQLLPK